MRNFVMRLAIGVAFLGLWPADGAAQMASSVSAGYEHTCAVSESGGVLCWGGNDSGQVGDGSMTFRTTPTPVSGLVSGVQAVTAGWYHTCALTTAGAVLCWGRNGHGQLGDGTTLNRSTPVSVSGLSGGVVAVAAGGYHTCARTTGGAMLCWGYNDFGQLGDGTQEKRSTPMQVSGLLSGIEAIATGYQHTCALTTAGAMLCWGDDSEGQVGDGTYGYRTTPVPVSGLSNGVATIAAGYKHTCAVAPRGEVMCWGYNVHGQVGSGKPDDRLTPAAVDGLGSPAVQVSAGYNHTCALTISGDVLCWGANSYGQLGDGTPSERLTPTAVSGLDGGVAWVRAGANHTCALTKTRGAKCWGLNDWGRLGDGTTDWRYTPIQVPGFEGRMQTAGDFSGDVKADVLWRHATRGEVWLWVMNGASKSSECHVGTVPDMDWEIRGLGDQNGDGKADLLWRNKTTGMLYYWQMDGCVKEAEAYVDTVEPAYDIVGTGDYDGDGRSDILWRHLTNGQVWLWLMNGPTTLGVSYAGTVDPAYEVQATGDLNADWKDDIVWRHSGTGDVWVWVMNGANPTTIAYVMTVSELAYGIVGVADQTGDGRADILWRHDTRGEAWLWPMNEKTLVIQPYVGTVPDTGYRIVGNGDYDGDGKTDILWQHNIRGEVWIWLMDGAAALSETYVDAVSDIGFHVVGGRYDLHLRAPNQLSPADGSVFSVYPRITEFTWSPVPGAVAYVFELDCFHCCAVNQWCSDVRGTGFLTQVPGTSHTLEWVGAQPGRWRVWAIGADGKPGAKTPWWYFLYTV